MSAYGGGPHSLDSAGSTPNSKSNKPQPRRLLRRSSSGHLLFSDGSPSSVSPSSSDGGGSSVLLSVSDLEDRFSMQKAGSKSAAGVANKKTANSRDQLKMSMTRGKRKQHSDQGKPASPEDETHVVAPHRQTPAAAGQIPQEVTDLQEALKSMQEKLEAKDAEIAALSRIRKDVDSELEELTASLFEEAHKMVRQANVKQVSAEKALAEATMKIDGLETEVSALKALVLTSTPSQPNKHLHPQLGSPSQQQEKKDKKTQQSPKKVSESSFSRSRLFNGLSSPERTAASAVAAQKGAQSGSVALDKSKGLSVAAPVVFAAVTEADDPASQASMDPTLRDDFLRWRRSPTLSRSDSPFIDRVFREDVDPCLSFPNSALSALVAAAIAENGLSLTPVKECSRVPRNCALMEAPVLCRYKLKILRLDGAQALVEGEEGEDVKEEKPLDEDEEEHFVCQLARNRLTSVCDLLGYMRYVQNGLVKRAHANDVYWEIMRLRRNVGQARLGFAIPEQD